LQAETGRFAMQNGMYCQAVDYQLLTKMTEKEYLFEIYLHTVTLPCDRHLPLLPFRLAVTI
jgi:hypothetical protein